MYRAKSRRKQVKQLVTNFNVQLAGLLADSFGPEELLPQSEQVKIKKNGNKSLQDSKLKKVSSMAMKMAEMLDCEQEVASPGSDRINQDVFDSEDERICPGPVIVCGPPGTEPVPNISRTRFDEDESLVYSRVSLDMSISPGYIHKSGCISHIPPKDTPRKRAEVFARPWQPKLRVKRNVSPDLLTPSSSLSPSSPSSSSSPSTSVTFEVSPMSLEPSYSPSSFRRLTRARAKHGGSSSRFSFAPKGRREATARNLGAEHEAVEEEMNFFNSVSSSSEASVDSELEDEDKKMKEAKDDVKAAMSMSESDGNDDYGMLQEDVSTEEMVYQSSGNNVDRPRKSQRRTGTAKDESSLTLLGDICGDSVGANIDVATSSGQDQEENFICQASKNEWGPGSHLKEEEEGDGIFQVETRYSSVSSAHSVSSSLAPVYDDIQESFKRKADKRSSSTKKTSINLSKKRLKSDSNEPNSNGHGSNVEASDLKSKMDKELQLVLPKLSARDLKKLKLPTESLPEEVSSCPVTSPAEVSPPPPAETSPPPAEVSPHLPAETSPPPAEISPKKIKRERGDGGGNSGVDESPSHGRNCMKLSSRLGVDHSRKDAGSPRLKIKQELGKEESVRVVARHKDQVQGKSRVKVRKRAEKDGENHSSLSSEGFTSSNDDITISDVENVIPPCPSTTKSKSVTQEAMSSSGKSHSPKAKQSLEQSVLSSDSDFESMKPSMKKIACPSTTNHTPKSKCMTQVEVSSSSKNLTPRAKRSLDQSLLSPDSDFENMATSRKKRKVMQSCSSDDEELPATSPTLTVKVSRKATTLKGSVNLLGEGNAGAAMMDWESWDKDKTMGKVKSEFDAAEELDGTLMEDDKIKMQTTAFGESGIDDTLPSDNKNDNPLPGGSVSDDDPEPDDNDGIDSDNGPLVNESVDLVASASKTSPSRTSDPVTKRSSSIDPDSGDLAVDTSEAGKTKGDIFPSIISCTACGKDINWSTQIIHSHPRLEVLICQYCHSVVNSGEFSMDDANEVYCSLCGDGGAIVLCDFCNKSFCYACIERISGKGYLKELLESETTKFECYVCNSQLLSSARDLCQGLTEHLRRSKCAQLTSNKRRTRRKKGTLEDTVKVDENANIQASSVKQDDLETKESEPSDKVMGSTRKKVALTPAKVEEEDTDSDSSHNEGKSPEVQTDDIMSDSNLCEELARRKKKSKDVSLKKEKPSTLDPVDPTSSTSDAPPVDSGGKKKLRKKKRANILAGYSSEEEEKIDNKDTKKTVSPISSNSSDSSGSEVKNKEKKENKQKRNKRNRMASYSSDSGADSRQRLQLQLSGKSSGGEREEREEADAVQSSSPESVEYRIPNTHSHSDSPLSSDIEPMLRKKKKRDPLNTLTSSDEETSVNEKPSKRRSLRRKKGSPPSDRDSDDFMDEGLFLKGPRRRRRQRIKNLLTSDSESESGEESSDNDEDEEEEEEEDEVMGSQDPKGKKRKKIRKLIGDGKLASETKQALQEEKERAERLKKRKKLATEEVENRLVLEQDPESKEVKLEVRRALVPNILPHQREGIKFLYDACVESLDRVAAGRGTGAILAHCMGLGKTLQLIAFVDALLNCEKQPVKRVLILCPVNTIYNWRTEFFKWIAFKDMEYNVYLLNEPNMKVSLGKIRKWFVNGGVLIMGYERFRNLSLSKRIKRAKQKLDLQKFLLDPGADLVVCDEGHIMRNSSSITSICINKVKTRLRVVLTGTPLQNNLQEYYTMVNFVKPNLLGTPNEFKNRFVNPITNGQCRDSSPEDIRMMRLRAHILYSLLKDTVQRKDYRILSKTLPPKQEYVLNIRLSPVQDQLYRRFLDKERGHGGFKSSSLFATYSTLAKIWNHPCVLKLDEQRKLEKEERRELYGLTDEEDFLDGFIVSGSEDEDEYTSRHRKINKKADSVSASSLSSSLSRTPTPLNSQHSLNSHDTPIAISSDSDSADLSYVRIKTEPSTTAGGGHRDKVSARGGTVTGVALRSGRSIKGQDELRDVPTTWYNDLLGDGSEEKLDMSGKLVFLFELLEETKPLMEKILVFSQSLLTLDLIEEFLSRPEGGDYIRAVDYCRLDGSSGVDSRTSNMSEFNKTGNARLRLFLISTRAGSLGVNLVAANRVVIFDACWNPSHDLQAIFRTYRYGQKKPVFVYRLLAQGTMEEKIYDRQVTKQSLSMRVVDEKQIGRHFNASDLSELFTYTPAPPPSSQPNEPKIQMPEDDVVLSAILQKIQAAWVVSYHHHDSLLEHIDGEELSEEEREVAWQHYKQQMSMENAKYNLEVLQNRLNSAASASASLQPASGSLQQEAIASSSAMPGVPGMLDPHAISPYDTFKVRTVTGLVSQAMHEVNQLKMNQNNLRHLRQLYANSPMIPRIHREQTQRLDMVIRQAVLNLHGKIQLVNDAIARFQASPLAMHPMYSNEVNKHRQILYNSLEDLRRMSTVVPTTNTTNTNMPATFNPLPNALVPGVPGIRSGIRGSATSNAHVTSTTNYI